MREGGYWQIIIQVTAQPTQHRDKGGPHFERGRDRKESTHECARLHVNANHSISTYQSEAPTLHVLVQYAYQYSQLQPNSLDTFSRGISDRHLMTLWRYCKQGTSLQLFYAWPTIGKNGESDVSIFCLLRLAAK